MRAVLVAALVAVGLSAYSVSFAFAQEGGKGADTAGQGTRSDILLTHPYGYGGYGYGGYYPYYSDYYYPNYSYSTLVYPGYYAQAYPSYGYQSFYPEQYSQGMGQYSQGRMGVASHITVRVPAPNAHLSLNGVGTRQMGMLREFDTPPVLPGYTYTYEAKAQWMDDNGDSVEKTRTVRFQPGQPILIDFTQPDTGTSTGTTSETLPE